MAAQTPIQKKMEASADFARTSWDSTLFLGPEAGPRRTTEAFPPVRTCVSLCGGHPR